MDLLRFLALLPPVLLSTSLSPVAYPTDSAPLHGIYVTSNTIASSAGMKLLDDWKARGGNMVVVDVQNGSKLAYPSEVELSKQLDNRGTQIADPTDLIHRLHDKGFYVAARYVLFKNPYLAAKNPKWALKNASGSSAFISRDGPVWLDPGNPEYLQYVIDTTRELAIAGFDEIQFDYVRFPDGPPPGRRAFSYTGEKEFSHDQAIAHFLAQVEPEIHAFGVKVSVDMFGIVAWDNITWKLIGQNVHEMAKYVDVIYPMSYPSHFGPGWGGHKNPADEPYYFVQETTKKFIAQSYPAAVKIRPWLQGFAMRVKNYTPRYVQDQIRALHDLGMEEYSIWNASNNYGMSFGAFKKVEIPKVQTSTSLAPAALAVGSLQSQTKGAQ